MISYDGSDFTTASLGKKGSPVRQDLVQNTGKVVKSIFVPNVGWASQVIHKFILYFTISKRIVFVIKKRSLFLYP